jgi:diguanylate cyclase
VGVSPPAALVPVAAVDVLACLVATVVPVRVAVRARVPLRPAYRLVAVAFVTGALVFAVAGARMAPAGIASGVFVPFAAGLSLHVIVLATGVLRWAGTVPDPAAGKRLAVDGLVLATAAAYVLWSVLLEPFPPRFPGSAPNLADRLAVLLSATPGLLAGSVCAVVAWRCWRRGSGAAPVLLAAAGVAGVAAAFVVALGYGTAAVILVAGAGHAVATVLLTVLIGRTGGTAPPAAEVRMGPGMLLAWGPVSVAIAACVVHLAVYHRADNTSILIAAVLGLALGGRQMLMLRDIRAVAAELAAREARYRELAHTDPLTGLGNRRAFLDLLGRRAVGGSQSVLLSIDLDGFKSVNDLRGHDVGDALLIEVARRLRSNLRSVDVAARLGGDEFAVLMLLRPDEAVAVAGRLRSVLSQPYDINGSTVYLSASIGLAPAAAGSDVPKLMRNADLALRFAKSRGKNRVEGYAETYTRWLSRRTLMESELRGAIHRDELSVRYQPVVSLATGRTVGVETLLCWRHPRLGTVPPGEFLPIAEESGVIDEIGRWVMGEACRQLSRWIITGLGLWLSVNISVRELHRPDYVSQVTDFIRAHRVPPDRLILEVSEHVVAVDVDAQVPRLAALREAGVRIALDDFGAGYSSLGRLRELPADLLKADVATIAPEGAGADGDLADVVVRLGTRLGIGVIVTGVADYEQRQLVMAAGGDLAQGELLAPPMPAERIETRLAAEDPGRVGRLPAPRRSGTDDTAGVPPEPAA